MLDELSVVSNDDDQFKANPTVIKILGCGGGGSSAVKRLIEAGVHDVEYVVLNTDLQALHSHPAPTRLAIGQKLTGGRGAGGNPDVGEAAAREDTEAIKNIINGSHMVVITAGMGGGTGTGSAPIVAQLAKESGALTVAVVTTPFDFEGPIRMKRALAGIAKLREHVDSIIVIPNQQLLKTDGRKLSFDQAYIMADEVLCSGIQGITQLITRECRPNLDFADVTSVLKDQGETILGVGHGEGENRVVDAAQAAISNPMLVDCQIDGATKILVNILSNGDLSIEQVDEIISNIRASASKDVEVFYGCITDPDMGDKISVTLIATGFKKGFDDDEDLDSVSEINSKETKDVVDYADFERVLKGDSNKAERKFEDEQPAPVSRPSSINIDSSSLFNFDEDQNSQPEEAGEVHTEPQRPVSSIDRIPDGYKIDPKDRNVPARWRQQLSREVNLSELDLD